MKTAHLGSGANGCFADDIYIFVFLETVYKRLKDFGVSNQSNI
jgi:hypothetical protein